MYIYIYIYIYICIYIYIYMCLKFTKNVNRITTTMIDIQSPIKSPNKSSVHHAIEILRNRVVPVIPGVYPTSVPCWPRNCRSFHCPRRCGLKNWGEFTSVHLGFSRQNEGFRWSITVFVDGFGDGWIRFPVRLECWRPCKSPRCIPCEGDFWVRWGFRVAEKRWNSPSRWEERWILPWNRWCKQPKLGI